MTGIPEYAVLTFGSLFAIVDPLAVIPAFLAMTASDTVARRRRMARVACFVCGLVMALFALLGPAIFHVLGITLAAFQVAGGLVLLLSSLDMLRAKRSPLNETEEETLEGISKDDVAVTPLAVPMLAGPGAISTSIVLAGKAQSWAHTAVFYACIVAVALATYLTFHFVASGARRISPTFLNVATRLMGLLLAAVGVQFILTALHLPG